MFWCSAYHAVCLDTAVCNFIHVSCCVSWHGDYVSCCVTWHGWYIWPCCVSWSICMASHSWRYALYISVNMFFCSCLSQVSHHDHDHTLNILHCSRILLDNIWTLWLLTFDLSICFGCKQKCYITSQRCWVHVVWTLCEPCKIGSSSFNFCLFPLFRALPFLRTDSPGKSVFGFLISWGCSEGFSNKPSRGACSWTRCEKKKLFDALSCYVHVPCL